jgi:hypothetical protein
VVMPQWSLTWETLIKQPKILWIVYLVVMSIQCDIVLIYIFYSLDSVH